MSSRVPPGVRITATLGEAVRLGWLSNDLFGAVEKFGMVTDYASSDGSITLWTGADRLLNQDAQYPENVAAMPVDAIDGPGQTLYVGSPDAAWTASTIIVQGLDENGDQQQGEAISNGQTPVEVVSSDGSSITWNRAFRAWNQTTPQADDPIYIADTNAGWVAGVAPANTAWIMIPNDSGDSFWPNQTLHTFYTIPRGYSGLIAGYSSNISRQNTPQVRESQWELQIRQRGADFFRTKHTWGLTSSGTSTYDQEFSAGILVSEGDDIRMRVAADINQLRFSGAFTLYLRSG